MKIVSLNVGMPREVMWHGRSVTTGIFKEPVPGRAALRKLNLDGDRQADLTVHGGEYKAVYCYPVEHYSYWAEEIPGRKLPAGIFGENFTTEGMVEATVHLGDRFSDGALGSVAFPIRDIDDQVRLPAEIPRRNPHYLGHRVRTLLRCRVRFSRVCRDGPQTGHAVLLRRVHRRVVAGVHRREPAQRRRIASAFGPAFESRRERHV